MKLDRKLQEWVVARKRHHLSHAHIQMARELGMNPRNLGSLDNHRQEPWKAPLPEFIEHLYEKRFGRTRPEVVTSIEERARQQAAARARKKAAKASRRTAAAGSGSIREGELLPTPSPGNDPAEEEPQPAQREALALVHGRGADGGGRGGGSGG